jgi:V/A-type H+-transporting ATPase subunit E
MAVTGLEKITEKILAEARAEADRILAEARAESERIRSDYAKRADELKSRISADASREGVDVVTRAKAASANHKRNQLLEAQSELIDDVFRSAQDSIRTQESDAYAELLTGLLGAALSEQARAEVESRELYGEEDMPTVESYEVLLNARDRDRVGQDLIDRVKKSAGGKLPADMLTRLVLAEDTVSIDGGLILRCGSIETNCSLALLFAQLREELEAEVCRVLFGGNRRG